MPKNLKSLEQLGVGVHVVIWLLLGEDVGVDFAVGGGLGEEAVLRVKDGIGDQSYEFFE